MNYRIIGKILGKIAILESILMLAPLAISLIYRESLINSIAFIAPAVFLAVLGLLLQRLKVTRQNLYQKEGFALVAMAWIGIVLFGAIPFVINSDIPNYIDACFETMSGFTTTGSSIITDITVLSHSSLFWRSFSHWIGGMGILVFVLIFIPESDEGSSLYLLRAESPGPQVGRLVSKMKVTTRILYLIYLAMTVLEVVILMLDEPLPGYENDQFFFSLLTTFGCAGTGGFGFVPGSMEMFPAFSQYTMAIFMLLFGCNFSLYYLLLIGKFREVLRSEEFRSYIVVVAIAVALVFICLTTQITAYPQTYTAEERFRHSLFQVASLMTTTGFTSTDYYAWPMLGKTTLVMVMFIGAMAGSTAGGIKVSRIVIALQGSYINVRKLINPRYVSKSKYEGKPLEERTVNDVFAFITLYFFFFIGAILLLSFDPINGQSITVVSDAGTYSTKHDFFTNLSASLACISNVGPGFEAVGPYSCYAEYSSLSKLVLTVTMLLGRLELLPVMLLFNPKTWKRV